MHIRVEQSEDGLWRWKIHEDATWQGGYPTETAARAAAEAAARGERQS